MLLTEKILSLHPLSHTHAHTHGHSHTTPLKDTSHSGTHSQSHSSSSSSNSKPTSANHKHTVTPSTSNTSNTSNTSQPHPQPQPRLGWAYHDEIPGSRCGPEDGPWPRSYPLLETEEEVWRELSSLARPQSRVLEFSGDSSESGEGGSGEGDFGRNGDGEGSEGQAGQWKRRADSVNFQPCDRTRTQDRYLVKQIDVFGLKWTLTGVLDGHLGEATVDHVAHHLPKIISEHLHAFFSSSPTAPYSHPNHPNTPIDPAQISTLLSSAIIAFDDAIAQDVISLFPGGLDGLDELTDGQISNIINDQHRGGVNYRKARLCMYGTTALVTLVDPRGENMWVANVGDCQAIIVTPDEEEDWHVEVLTTNHNGDNPDEVARLRREHPGEPDCVVDGRVLGALAPFRCLGDIPFKQPPKFSRRILYNLLPGFHDTSPWEEFLVKNITPPYISATPEITHRRLPISSPTRLPPTSSSSASHTHTHSKNGSLDEHKLHQHAAHQKESQSQSHARLGPLFNGILNGLRKAPERIVSGVGSAYAYPFSGSAPGSGAATPVPGSHHSGAGGGGGYFHGVVNGGSSALGNGGSQMGTPKISSAPIPIPSSCPSHTAHDSPDFDEGLGQDAVVHRAGDDRWNKQSYLILCSDGFADLCSHGRSQESVLKSWARKLPYSQQPPSSPPFSPTSPSSFSSCTSFSSCISSSSYISTTSSIASPPRRKALAKGRGSDNLALRLLREVLGGEDREGVARVCGLDMGVAWVDDTSLVVQVL